MAITSAAESTDTSQDRSSQTIKLAALVVRNSSDPPSLFSVLQRRLLVLRAHLGLQSAEAIALPVDEFAHLGERGMHFLNPAPHLLRDEAVVGMALGHGAQLAEVDRFAQVHLHVPADLVGEGHDVLGLAGKLAVNRFV